MIESGLDSGVWSHMLIFILLLPTFTIPILPPNFYQFPNIPFTLPFIDKLTDEEPHPGRRYYCSLPATAACRRRFSYRTYQLDPIINKLKIKRKRRGHMKFDRKKDKMRSILPLWQHKRGSFF